MTRLFTFWTGPLGYIEQMCLASMVAAGHSVDFFTYDDNPAVPEGVTVKDARAIMPRESVVSYRKRQSPALFANLFRYEGLRRELGIWVDCDMLLLRDLSDMGPFVVGWQDDRLINNAVLRLPADSEALRDIVAFANRPVVVPLDWPLRKRIQQHVASLFGLHQRLEDLPWGTIGPRLVTHFALRSGIVLQPAEVFYPVPWKKAASLFDPDAHLEDSFTAATRAVHLWNECIREQKKTEPPPGSFIARMRERFLQGGPGARQHKQ